MAVKLNDLPPGVRKGIEGKTGVVPSKLVTFGKVLQDLEGMTKRDALWVLRKTVRELGGKS